MQTIGHQRIAAHPGSEWDYQIAGTAHGRI
jgi:hypothetical protein